MRFCLGMIMVLSSQIAHADVPGGELSGSYFFSEDSCGTDGKAKSCKMSFNFTGKTARILYDRMTTRAVYDECTEGHIKTDENGLSCYKVKDEYNCHFGYDFAKRKLTDSDVIC